MRGCRSRARAAGPAAAMTKMPGMHGFILFLRLESSQVFISFRKVSPRELALPLQKSVPGFLATGPND